MLRDSMARSAMRGSDFANHAPEAGWRHSRNAQGAMGRPPLGLNSHPYKMPYIVHPCMRWPSFDGPECR